MESTLTGTQSQAHMPMTNSATRDLFRSKVRVVSNIVSAATTHTEGSTSSDEGADVVSMGAQRPQEQAKHTVDAIARELFARFNTDGEGLDRNQVIAALRYSGIDERDTFIDVTFAKCDACAIGRLERESFVRFCAIVHSRRHNKERLLKLTGRLAKEAEQREASQALPGYLP
eukprot:COSAG02_NODE_1307_length_13340_cov_84.665282_10_plen_173_part_00